MQRMEMTRRTVRCRQAGHRGGRGRRIGFHLAAMIVVLSPLAVGELVVRWCVSAPAVDAEDPYVSFSALRPLFVPDSSGTRFEIAEERLAAFHPQSFAAVKGPQTFRVFCLGGSTVQGRPYSVETSFATWLAFNLRAAEGETDWEIVNCGGISYASYRLVPVMRELLGHEPDLFIIYTGHNEFLEDRTYGRLKRTPRVLIRLHRTVLNLRSYALADAWLSRGRTRHSSKTVLSPEVQTKLDLEEGLESYHRDEAWRQGTIEHFRRNVDIMVGMAHGAGVPVILMNPVSNLKGCPPFRSQFRADLSEQQRQQAVDLSARAGKLDWTDVYGKITLLEQAVKIDHRHAGLLYQLGTCWQRLGRPAEAQNWLVRAKEEDVCPLRILEPMHEAIQDVAARHHVALVDVKGLIEDRTEDGIPGDEWLLDHVHPGVAGHQLIADALYQTMEQMKLVRTPGNWRATRDALWRRHLSSLDDVYYARGAARLKRLHAWSRGRIPGE